jgi:hypothetical protein
MAVTVVPRLRNLSFSGTTLLHGVSVIDNHWLFEENVLQSSLIYLDHHSLRLIIYLKQCYINLWCCILWCMNHWLVGWMMMQDNCAGKHSWSVTRYSCKNTKESLINHASQHFWMWVRGIILCDNSPMELLRLETSAWEHSWCGEYVVLFSV